VTQLTASTKQGIDAIGGTVEARLELMRATVDEKLSVTLDTRLAATFKQVGDRLEAVQTGLVEMRSLAGDVSDLRRVMVNVKARGTWGEVQLGNILEQIFSQDLYEKDFKPRQRSAEVVEYAIRLPGPDTEPVYLPIDSKFPIEDYLRLVEAAEAADKAGVESARTALGNRIWGCAKDIHDKYIAVPRTTNFAVLFLPTEALYAEVVRLPGVVEEIQNKYRVTVQGPSTFAAFANALLMGFRTVALQKRSAEVGKLLGAVRTDFGKFADLLGKVEERLDQAKERLGDARKRSTQIVKKLGKVEALPEGETAELLPDPAFDIDAIEEID
jgi:DNA recombination protein RmuC